MMLTEKHRPKKISEIVGQREGISKVLSFLKKSGKAAILHGPVGCGKTSAVHAIASELGYEVIELNAGDLRNRESIKNIIGNAVAQKSLFFEKKIILIDEIDNLTSQDYGGSGEIISVISSTKYPVIMCANKPFEKKLMNLRKKCEMIEFKRVSPREVYELLKKVCAEEGITAADNALKQLSLLSGGDLRAALNDLQASGKEINEVAVSKREQEVSIFNALRLIFKGRSISALNALDNIDVDFSEAVLWIDENLPSEYRNRDLFEAYQALSKADVFMKRISRQQHWHFLVYVNAMLTAGVALSKRKESNTYANYKKSGRLLKLWMSNSSGKRAVAEKFYKHVHYSSKKLFRELSYLKVICMDQKVKDNLAKELNLNKEEVELLLGPNRNRYF